jgi:hypothetical protein
VAKESKTEKRNPQDIGGNSVERLKEWKTKETNDESFKSKQRSLTNNKERQTEHDSRGKNRLYHHNKLSHITGYATYC